LSGARFPDGPRIALRAQIADDEPLLMRVYASTRERELAALPWYEEQRRLFVRSQFEAQQRHYRAAHPQASFDVVVVDGVDAGRIYVDRAAHELRLIDISLLPRFRGAGIGARLLRDLIAEAHARGVPVGLHVQRDNPALRLYERLGFELLADDGVYLSLACRPVQAKGAS
jgi:ribosomal protein S18 acetylase RimI-like enzyme